MIRSDGDATRDEKLPRWGMPNTFHSSFLLIESMPSIRQIFSPPSQMPNRRHGTDIPCERACSRRRHKHVPVNDVCCCSSACLEMHEHFDTHHAAVLSLSKTHHAAWKALPCLATAPPHSSEDEMNQRRHEGAAPKDTLSNQPFFAWKIRKRKDHTRRKIPPPSPSSLPLAVLAPSRQCGRADPLYLSKTSRYLGTEEKQQEKFLSRHIASELFWCSLEGLSDLQTQRPALR